MKAIVRRDYGPPEVLEYREVEKPEPEDEGVLVAVRAAALNPLDWHFMRGTPYALRLATGVRKPRDTRLGVDVAGSVEAVGRNVRRFKPGDEVFGSCRGAFAEHATTTASLLVVKPANVTFEQAASAPVAAYTALQAFRDKGRLEPGQKLLINGASGGVGTFAVQIAKSMGADVTGVCSTKNVAMVRSIGADRVIDYTREDFTRGHVRYDMILDAVGNRSPPAFRRVLARKGTYVGVSGAGGNWVGPLIGMAKTLMLSPFVSQEMVWFLVKPNGEDLALISELMAAGKVTPVIDRRYALREVPEAIRYLEEGHARGKVIVTVSAEP
ncbi:MAG TPA: NAD(P)-dependent alcohol dehydrogenase [Vicinamibacterales bacterium]|nr:NAD(P)-dependent alcohol dehydrogenase [Vicinamibacterales bacterium]